jgi:hypothetical protein
VDPLAAALLQKARCGGLANATGSTGHKHILAFQVVEKSGLAFFLPSHLALFYSFLLV